MIASIENIYAGKGLYQEMLAPLCRKYDLTDTQLVILLYLADANPADTATMIIRYQRLKKSVVSMSIDDLEKKSLIESYFEDGDRRTKHLRVLPQAFPIVKEARSIQDELYSLMMDGISDEDKLHLERITEKINENIAGYHS